MEGRVVSSSFSPATFAIAYEQLIENESTELVTMKHIDTSIMSPMTNLLNDVRNHCDSDTRIEDMDIHSPQKKIQFANRHMPLITTDNIDKPNVVTSSLEMTSSHVGTDSIVGSTIQLALDKDGCRELNKSLKHIFDCVSFSMKNTFDLYYQVYYPFFRCQGLPLHQLKRL